MNGGPPCGGSPAFCDRHWRKVLKTPGANFHAATVEIVQRFIAAMNEQALHARRGPLLAWEIQKKLDELGPPCCYLGDEVVDDVILVALAVGDGPIA
jgi:hypothetical protein